MYETITVATTPLDFFHISLVKTKQFTKIIRNKDNGKRKVWPVIVATGVDVGSRKTFFYYSNLTITL